jgi:hypothetical protein
MAKRKSNDSKPATPKKPRRVREIPNHTTHDPWGRPLFPPSAILDYPLSTDEEGFILPPGYKRRI